MYFAICDDNLAHSQLLQEALDRYDDLAINVETYRSGEELLADLEKNGRRFDAYFLDMEMEGMNGIDTANAILAWDRRANIVFVTSHRKYMEESFACRPVDYLVKPVTKDALDRVLTVLVRIILEERPRITFTDNKRFVQLYGDEIIFCESDGHWIHIYTAKETYRTRMTMAELEQKLPQRLFARAAKGYLVNLDQVKSIDGYDLYLRDTDRVLSLGRTYAKSFKQALTVRAARRRCL